MDAKHLTPLAVLAAVSVAATAWVSHTSPATVASDRRGEPVIPALFARVKADTEAADAKTAEDKARIRAKTPDVDITGLVVRDGAGTVAVELRDNRFVAADSGYPIRMDTIREVVMSSAELAFEESRTADPKRYGDLGLADPGAKDASGKDAKDTGKEITFRTNSGDLADFVVGKTDATPGGTAGGVFIRIKGEAQTFLARGNVRLPATRSEWFVPFDLDVKRKEVKRVDISGGSRDSLTASADADKPGALVLADVPEKRTADDFKVSRLATLVESFTFQDVRKAVKAAADGVVVPDPDEPRRMMVDAAGGLRLTITSVGNVSDGWVRIAAEATEDAAKDKAKLIMSKVEGYDFRLPSNLSEVLGWTVTDVTNEQKEPKDKGGPGAAGIPPGIPPGLLPGGDTP
jgi:Domain of unknown function (DUF4340)